MSEPQPSNGLHVSCAGKRHQYEMIWTIFQDCHYFLSCFQFHSDSMNKKAFFQGELNCLGLSVQGKIYLQVRVFMGKFFTYIYREIWLWGDFAWGDFAALQTRTEHDKNHETSNSSMILSRIPATAKRKIIISRF